MSTIISDSVSNNHIKSQDQKTYNNISSFISEIKQLIIEYKLLNITLDSRETNQHTIFVAIKGHKFDGKSFIPSAVNNGCRIIFTYSNQQNLEYIAKRTIQNIHDHNVVVFEIFKLEQYLSFVTLKFFDFLSVILNPNSLGMDIPVIGITGTNGKTLTSTLIAQAFSRIYQNQSPYLMGTVGFGKYPQLKKAINTTPDACTVMREIFYANEDHASAMVMEVSSHGLYLNRVRNVRFSQAIFTNLTQDHLDFHHTIEEYFQAKALLFTTHNVKDYIITCNGKSDDFGARLVDMVAMKISTMNDDSQRGAPAYASAMMAVTGSIPSSEHIAGSENIRPNPLGVNNSVPFLNDIETQLQNLNNKSRIAVINIGESYNNQVCYKADIIISLIKIQPHPAGLTVTFSLEDKEKSFRQTFRIQSSLLGIFNAYNLLAVFCSLYLQLNEKIELILNILSQLTPAPGRMQVIPNNINKTIIVDFAHTPDALEKSINSTLCHFNQKDYSLNIDHKLWVVFGCGGERDVGKRPIMGKIAASLADYVIVTDDNPRSEDPQSIGQQVLAGCIQAKTDLNSTAEFSYIGDRKTAIIYAMTNSKLGDIILIAGKGHETEQVLADRKIHFSDSEEVLKIINSKL